MISLGASWAVWVAVGWAQRRKVDALQAGQTALVAVAVAIPTTLNYVALRETGVLAQRTLAPTPAHTPWLVLIGYGFLAPLAVVGVWAHRRSKWGEPEAVASPVEAIRLLAIWAMVPLLIQYLPTSFQRKLIMGVHLPLSLLAGLGLLALIHAGRPALRWAALGLAVLLPLSNVVVTGAEFRAARHPGGSSGRDVLLADERRAMDWIRENAPPEAIVEPVPRFVRDRESDDWDPEASVLDRLTPGYTGRSVECGHWCETPNYQAKLDEWQEFADAGTEDAERRTILRRKGVGLLVISDRDAPDAPGLTFGAWRMHPPDYLWLVPEASTSDVRVYQVLVRPSVP